MRASLHITPTDRHGPERELCEVLIRALSRTVRCRIVRAALPTSHEEVQVTAEVALGGEPLEPRLYSQSGITYGHQYPEPVKLP